MKKMTRQYAPGERVRRRNMYYALKLWRQALKGADLDMYRVVTRPQGSWKWQNRYGLRAYNVKLSLKGVWYYAAAELPFESLTDVDVVALTKIGVRVGGMHRQEVEWQSQGAGWAPKGHSR